MALFIQSISQLINHFEFIHWSGWQERSLLQWSNQWRDCFIWIFLPYSCM